MMNDSWHGLTIASAARRIAAREISPLDLTGHLLRRIDILDSELHSFVHVATDQALSDAARAEREIMGGHHRGPLHGIPLAIKDIYDVRGMPTTCHSRLRLGRVPERDATAVARLREAGAVLLGKLATHEFALGGPSFDLPWPPARNPWDTDRFTGGSSSGAAAAVAAGLCLGAMGSDTSGSIRTPAALCGVAGLKPTYGRVSRAGVMPLAYTMDHCGPMAWTVEDTSLMLQAISGHDPEDPTSVDLPLLLPDFERIDLEGVRVGLIRNFYQGDDRAAPQVCSAMEQVLEQLEQLGADVGEVRLPSLQSFHACSMIIMLSEAFAIHEDDLRKQSAGYGECARDRFLLGAYFSAADYINAQRCRRQLANEVKSAFEAFDVLITAATWDVAPPIDQVTKLALFERASLAAPFSLIGYPAIVVRSGFSEEGLPLGAQLIGMPFDEATLLRAAHAYEQATPWHDRRPSWCCGTEITAG
jgi:aspartyl-tRNA(Asn)/glutamyl-tRNA(Gln) amidotransferase subunit A